MTLCLFFSLALPHLVGSLLPASLKCSPVRRAWDVRAAAMMAWRVSLPGCLFMAKLLMSSRRYRLVGPVSSGGARSGAYSSPVPSWRFAPCSSRPASRFSSRRASRCDRPAFDVFFLCLFHPVLRWHALARFVPVPVSSVSSRRPVSSCVSGGGGSSCAACLTCPDGILLISSYRFVGRDGERSALMRLRNLFRGIFMNWE